MKPSIAASIRALQAMSVGELQEQCREVFGEKTRSRHKTFLWRRIAWRLQALEEGDLSERACRRIAELANDADVRIRPPRGAFAEDGGPPGIPRLMLLGRRDARLPVNGRAMPKGEENP